MTRGLCVIAAGLVLAGCSGGAGGEGGAYRACERAVETTLRAPSTANFSGATGSEITKEGDLYRVVGTVDSENGFGATLRSSFTCQLREVDDNWDLVDLDVA